MDIFIYIYMFDEAYEYIIYILLRVLSTLKSGGRWEGIVSKVLGLEKSHNEIIYGKFNEEQK